MEANDDLTFYAPANAAGPWRSVQAMLRQRHEETAADVARAIEERVRLGVPLDNDGPDWREYARARADEAFKSTDREASRAALRAAWIASLGGLRPLDAYVADPAIDTVEVRLRAMARDEYASLTAEILACRTAAADAGGVEALRSVAAQQGPIRRFVARAVVGLRGVQLEHGEAPPWEGDELPAIVVDALDAAGLVTTLYAVADRYQELGPLQRRGFGSPRPSTSPTSTAAHVLAHSASPEDARSPAEDDRTSSGNGSRPGVALRPTSEGIGGSPRPFVTIAPATANQGSERQG